jgi:Alpha amylase, catalytic domain
MRLHPHLYEANTLIMLRRLSKKHGRELTLATVPEEEWQRLAGLGFDLLWLMGVWQRSPASRQIALAHSGLRTEYDKALPGWTEQDVAGSPYAIHNYTLDPNLGQEAELSELKYRLNRQGLGLVLDFVPNHLALDHPWTSSYPDRFVPGSEEDIRAHPEWFFPTSRGVYLAHGRDPYFPPWTDTVQVNFFSPDLRDALVSELLRIAQVADGVRCDMAMLGLNSIFERVWGSVIWSYPRPGREFWPYAIEKVKQQRPDFLFLAEVYWGLEGELQEMGFDFTYDKALYDYLRSDSPSDIRRRLEVDAPRQQRWVRFIENHDEARAVTAFGPGQSRAAAIVLATVPGLRLFHDGQLEAKRVRLPVQLGREPAEPPDPEISQFYHRLLSICNSAAFHEGEWRVLGVRQAWESNQSYQNLLAWAWRHEAQTKIVVVNYAPHFSQGRLNLRIPEGDGASITLRDELNDRVYVRNVNELHSQGLYVELGPWGAHILDLRASPSS